MLSAKNLFFSPSKYELWIADRDENGKPIHAVFVETAYSLAKEFFQYRKREMTDESIVATLAQASVDAVSKTVTAESIENPAGYLFTTFRNKVDRYLASTKRQIPREAGFIEDLINRQQTARDTVSLLDNQILLRQIKSCMDAETRRIFHMRVAGYSMEAVAKSFGEPANRIAVRYSRGIDRAADILLKSRPNRGKSKADGE